MELKNQGKPICPYIRTPEYRLRRGVDVVTGKCALTQRSCNNGLDTACDDFNNMWGHNWDA